MAKPLDHAHSGGFIESRAVLRGVGCCPHRRESAASIRGGCGWFVGPRMPATWRPGRFRSARVREQSEIGHRGEADGRYNRLPCPERYPRREMTTRAIADDRGGPIRYLCDLADRVDRSHDVLRGGGPTPATTQPAVLQIPGGPPPCCQVDCETLHAVTLVLVQPEAAVDQQHQAIGVMLGAAQFPDLIAMGAVAKGVHTEGGPVSRWRMASS